MSFTLTLSSSRSCAVRRPARRDATSAEIDLPAILIKTGGFLAGVSLLVGVMLYNMDSLTLFWVKLLPIPTCSGGAFLSLGVLILCIRELRTSADVTNFDTRTGNSV